MNRGWKTWVLAAAAALGSQQALADLLTDPAQIESPVVINFDAGIDGAGNVGMGTGYTVKFSTSGGQGYVGGPPFGLWALGDNGFWTSAKTFAGVDGGVADDGSVAAMVFDFAGLTVRKVGGVLNFDPGLTYGGGLPLPMYIAAYDLAGNLLTPDADYEVPVFTPPAVGETEALDQGVFFGISRPSADIARFVIVGPYAVVDDLAFTTPVPEPGTYALLFGGLALVAMTARRSHRRRIG